MALVAPEYHVDFYSDEFIRDPHTHYADMRALGAVVFLPQLNNYALTQHAVVQSALRDHELFTSAKGVAGDTFGSNHLQGNTVASDPPRHTTLRKAMAPPLLPGALDEIRPEVERVAANLIDGLLQRDGFDAIKDLARHLPLKIVTEMVGLPDFGQDNMLKWAAAAFDVLGMQNERGQKGLEAITEMREFIAGRITPDTVKPGSWTYRVLELVKTGQLDSELAPFAIRDYINPSLDTTISATGELIWQLSQNPDQWRRLRENPDLCRQAVNEAVRLGTPIRSFTRRATRAVEIDGVAIPEDARVMMLYACANRDERVFKNPDQFDVTRNSKDHLGFGSGIHTCIGMHLAQLEMICLLQAMIPRVSKISVGTPTLVLNNTIAAFATLPTKFEAASGDLKTLAISHPPPHANLLDVTIIARAMVATDIVSLTLSSSTSTPLPIAQAGAHIDIYIQDGLVRQYSLTGKMSHTYQIAVQKEPSSRGGSIAVHDLLQVGTQLKIGEPRNVFPLVMSNAHSILFSGGIGLTPILAMAWQLHESKRAFEWHLSARSIDRIAFGKKLDQLPFAEKIVIHLDDDPNGTPDVASAIKTASLDSHAYICGPKGYIDYILGLASSIRFSDNQLHVEHFGAEIDTNGEPFEIFAARSNKLIKVNPNDTILSALTRAGIHVATSCENGVCGSCLTKVLKGKPDHRDLVLTDAEKSMNNKIAVCCSRSQSKRLELDI